MITNQAELLAVLGKCPTVPIIDLDTLVKIDNHTYVTTDRIKHEKFYLFHKWHKPSYEFDDDSIKYPTPKLKLLREERAVVVMRNRDAAQARLREYDHIYNPVQAHPVAQQVNFAQLEKEELTQIFWAAIKNCEWRNKSDGVCSLRTVQRALSAFTTENAVNAFAGVYGNYYADLEQILEHDGLFDRFPGILRMTIVSHIIGLGKDSYDTLCGDMQLVQFLVGADECQNLDNFMPHRIRVGRY